MNGSASAEALSAVRITELAHLPRDQLLTLWAQHLGQAAPKTMSTALILRAVAYEMQLKEFGGLKRHEHKALAAATRAAEHSQTSLGRSQNLNVCHSPPDGLALGEGETGPSTGDASDSSHRLKKHAVRMRSVLKPGTRLIRNWQGKAHVVDVYKEGFGWNGNIYGSLTVIAREITGTHWSGPRFFRT